MGSDSASRINQVLKAWPNHSVALSSWLEAHGVYQQLAHRYEQTAWLNRIGQGAFIKAGDEVSWEGALYALQEHAKLPIHAAAKTALELHGNVHFVQSGKNRRVQLFGSPKTHLPAWFKNHDWKATIKYTTANLFAGAPESSLTEKNLDAFSIRISTRERAIFEVLHLIPSSQSYEEAKLLFEGLRTLRPSVVQSLLETCRSVKVKRLFLHLAELTSQPWFSELNLAKVSLGKGKRVIGDGGVFDSKYDISVPKIRDGSSSENELEGA